LERIKIKMLWQIYLCNRRALFGRSWVLKNSIRTNEP
jgi:hypothetical protein